jgi:hypothetical protein
MADLKVFINSSQAGTAELTECDICYALVFKGNYSLHVEVAHG